MVCGQRAKTLLNQRLDFQQAKKMRKKRKKSKKKCIFLFTNVLHCSII